MNIIDIYIYNMIFYSKEHVNLYNDMHVIAYGKKDETPENAKWTLRSDVFGEEMRAIA